MSKSKKPKQPLVSLVGQAKEQKLAVEDDPSELPHAVLVGNLFEGWTVFGPFDCIHHAINWIDETLDDEFTIMPLFDPEHAPLLPADRLAALKHMQMHAKEGLVDLEKQIAAAEKDAHGATR
jgi:hypothetical protein